MRWYVQRRLQAGWFAVTATAIGGDDQPCGRRILALTQLRSQRDAKLVAPVAAAEGKAHALKSKCDLIKQLATFLGSNEAKISMVADDIRATGDPEALDAYRDNVIGLVRTALLEEHAALTKKAARLPTGTVGTAPCTLWATAIDTSARN